MKFSDGGIKNLAKSLVAAQKSLKNPALDRANTYFKNHYATLKSVRESVQPVFAEHGLAITQHLQRGEGGVVCETVVMHESGEWMSSDCFIPVTKQDPQAYGVASTYARRYSMQAVANVVGDEDTDGEEAEPSKGEQAYAAIDEALNTLADLCRAVGVKEADAAIMKAGCYAKYGIPNMQAIKSAPLEAVNEMIAIVTKLPAKG